MNPTNSSTTNNISLHPKPHQYFFPQIEQNPPHLYGPSNRNHAGGHSSSSVYLSAAAAGPFLYYSHGGIRLCSRSDPDPVCLKHGKRHCGNKFRASGDQLAGVRRRNSSARTPAVPRCQVQGCHVSLENARDYQERHKVCEMHSKASKAIVLGLDQRFCQRCCRFHVVSEFDGSKRSCRRKLADHNQRRRKSTHDSLVPEKFTADGALSLLSTTVNNWNITTSSPSDISSRSSAALGLIAENRAANFSSNLHHNYSMNQEQQEGAVTLDLMGAPSTAQALGFLSESRHVNNEDAEEECAVLWNSELLEWG